MKLASIDFETANSKLCSPCELGICVYEDGPIEEYNWLIKPESDYNYFTNTFIHGITYEDVKDAPSFDTYYEKLKEILKDAVIVAHNVRFDLGVLNATLDLYDLKHFNNLYFDSVIFARKVFPNLINHKLNTVSEHLNIELDHHHALSDARACLLIILKTMEKSGIYDLNDLLDMLHIKLKHNI